MKFVTFLKIFAICFFSMIGIFGIGYGIMVATGKFDVPDVFPSEFQFEFSEYNKDGDFKMKVVSSTVDVNKLDVVLSFDTQNSITTNSDGTITDGVVTIPQNIKLNEEFTVKVNKTINDPEANGQDWITGGHSKLRAFSQNEELAYAKTTVNIDVPVYSVSVNTSAINDSDVYASEFAVQSKLFASLQFAPARSKYSYSMDGKNGYATKLKNTYFTTLPSAVGYLTQVGVTNEFSANVISENIEIQGYCFATSRIDEQINELYKEQDETFKHNSILGKLKEYINDTSSDSKLAFGNTTKINILDVNVDSMIATGTISNVNIDESCILYANKETEVSSANASNLELILSSSLNANINLQQKIENIGIRFLVKEGGNFVDAVNNSINEYNVVKMLEDGYSKTVSYVNDQQQTEIYYFPKMTSNPNDSYWKFAITKEITQGNLQVVIKYFDEENTLETITKSFGTTEIVSNPVSWNNELTSQNRVLKIYNSLEAAEVEYEELHLDDYAEVPSSNLYKTRRYFAWTSDNADLTTLISCKNAVEYSLGRQSQSFTLYEIPDGILKAKTVNAHGLSINVLFVTVETDYKGQPKIEDGKYIINQYSQNALRDIVSVSVTFEKTIRQLVANVQLLANENYVTSNQGTEEETNLLYFVQSTNSAFRVKLTTGGEFDETEKQLLIDAVGSHDQDDNSRDVQIIAKLGDEVVDIIQMQSFTPINEQGKPVEFVFDMDIKELAAGNKSSIVNLYIRYKKSETVTQDTLINSFSIQDDLTTKAMSGIEVYNGEAETFKFTINTIENANVSEDNRIKTYNKPNYREEGSSRWITGFTTAYELNNNDVIEDILQDWQEGDYSIKVTLLDKYDQLPVSSDYKLVSSNTSILMVSGKTVVLCGDGEVDLTLCDAEGNIKDTLYLVSETLGHIDSVAIHKETISGGQDTSSMEEVYNAANAEKGYGFEKQVVQIVGYKGNTINLFDTSETDRNNLITFNYKWSGNDIYDLLEALTIRIKGVTENIDDSLAQYIEINGKQQLDIKEDFGQRTTLDIFVTINGLGVTQEITLEILPNENVTVNAKTNSPESYNAGVIRYEGVYANSDFVLDVLTTYEMDCSHNSYAWYVSDNTDSIGNKMSSSFSNEYISSFNVVADTNTESKLINQVSYTIVFNDIQQRTPLILTYARSDSDLTKYDVLKTVYVYLVPNVKVAYDADSVHNFNSQTADSLGEINLLGIVNLSREFGEKDLNGTVSYEVVGNEEYFGITNSTLTLKKAISGIKTVQIKVLYNNFNVENGATQSQNEEYFYITLKVAPSVGINSTSTQFVTYQGEKHLVLENTKSYNLNTLKEQFTAGTNVTISSVSISKLFGSSYCDSLEDENDYTQDWTIRNVTDKIVTTIESQPITITITLSNGCSMTYPIILMPSQLLVNYSKIDESNFDLADLLDAEYLLNNKEEIAETVTGSGTSAQSLTNIFITSSVSGGETTYSAGVFKTSNPLFMVSNENLDDANAYLSITVSENNLGNITAVAVGEDKYVIVYVTLSSNANALTIPYLIKLNAELKLNVFYPYMNDNESIDRTGLNQICYDSYSMEYLSFDVNKQVVVDFAQNQSIYVPYKSSSQGQRYEIVRYKEGEVILETPQTSGVNIGFVTQFEVSEVWYLGMSLSWQQATNTSLFANFSKTNTSELTISANAANILALRVKVKISLVSGLVGYYYISVGEISEYVLTQLDENNVKTTTLSDLEFIANSEYVDVLKKYSLNIAKTNIITSEIEGKDVTSSLGFYATNSILEIDGYKIKVGETVKDVKTELVIFTKHGQLAVIPVTIKTNYEARIGGNAVSEYNVNSLTVFRTTAIEIFDISKNPGVKENSVQYSTVIANGSEFVKINPEADDNFAIKFGLATEKVSVPVTFTTNKESNGECYSFTITFIINPIIKVQDGNTRNTPYDILDDLAAGNADGYSDKVKIDDLLESLSNDNDAKSIINSANTNKTLNDSNGLESKVIEGIGAATVEYSVENGTFTIKTQLVGQRTPVTVEFSVIDFAGRKISAYFRFSVIPDFVVTVSYPQADDSNPSDELFEKFYAGADGENIFNLTETTSVGTLPRVQVKELNGDDYESDKLKVVVVAGFNVTVKDDSDADIGTSPVEFDKSFKFNTSESLPEVQFKVVLDGTNIEVATYTIKIATSIDQVYGIKAVNLSSTGDNKINNSSNREQVYVGVLDESLFEVVNLNYKLKTNVESNTYYVKFKIDDNAISDTQFGTESGGYYFKIDKTYYDYTNSVAIMLPQNLTKCEITYEIYTFSDGNYNLNENIKLDIETSLTSRVHLLYCGKPVSFDKNYKLILSKKIEPKTIGEELNASVEVNVGSASSTKSEEITKYYYDYDFDVTFAGDSAKLKAGQKMSFTTYNSDNPGELKFYEGSFKMQRVSNSLVYEKNDFLETGIFLQIEKIEGNDRSYIRTEAKYAKEEEDSAQGLLYDYVIFAQGAPNEAVTVTITLRVCKDSVHKEFVFTISVENDYHITKLLNADGSINNEQNRFIIAAINETSGSTLRTFAIYNSIENEAGNYIQFVHEFENNTINSAPYFSVSYSQNEKYIERYSSEDLRFILHKASYGNKNIDLTFVDAYGYEFKYYITIQAVNNPVYNGGQIIAYEGDTLVITEPASTGNVLDNEVFIEIDSLGDENVSKDLYFRVKDSDGKTYKLESLHFIASSSESKFTLATINLEGQLKTLGYKDGFPLSGELDIHLTSGDETAIVSINFVLQQRYTVTANQNSYVRDGVTFSLLEVLDVVDNKTSSIVADRSLTNVHTIMVEIQGGQNIRENASLGIMLTEKNSNNPPQIIPLTLSTLQTGNIGYMVMLEYVYSSSFDVNNYTYNLVYKEPDSTDDKGTLVTSEYKIVETDGSLYSESESNTAPKHFEIGAYTGTDSDSIELKIDEIKINAFIIDDVMLLFNKRNLNGQTVKVVFDNNKTIQVSCDKDITEEFSLYEYFNTSYTTADIDFKYQAGTNSDGSDMIIKGLALSDIELLKNIKISKVSDNNTTVTNTDVFTLSSLQDNPFYKDEEGIEYKSTVANYSITINNSSVTFSQKVAYRVTLKYIGVDTSKAYGTEKVKIVYVENDKITDNKLKDNLEVTLADWSGQSNGNRFELVAGKSTIQEFSSKTEDLGFVNAVNNGNISFALKEDTNGVSLVSDSGDNKWSLVFEKGNYDVLNSYVTIQVYCKYSDKTGDSLKHIGNVVVALRPASIETITLSTGLVKVTETISGDTTKRSVTYADLCNAIVVRNLTNSWTGTQLAGIGVTFKYNGAEITTGIENVGADGSTISVDVFVDGEKWGTLDLILTSNSYVASSTNVYRTTLANSESLVSDMLKYIQGESTESKSSVSLINLQNQKVNYSNIDNSEQTKIKFYLSSGSEFNSENFTSPTEIRKVVTVYVAYSGVEFIYNEDTGEYVPKEYLAKVEFEIIKTNLFGGLQLYVKQSNSANHDVLGFIGETNNGTENILFSNMVGRYFTTVYDSNSVTNSLTFTSNISINWVYCDGKISSGYSQAGNKITFTELGKVYILNVTSGNGEDAVTQTIVAVLGANTTYSINILNMKTLLKFVYGIDNSYSFEANSYYMSNISNDVVTFTGETGENGTTYSFPQGGISFKINGIEVIKFTGCEKATTSSDSSDS